MKKQVRSKGKKFDKAQAGFLLLNRRRINLSMQQIKEYLIKFRDKLKDGDNYLTSITVFAGIFAFVFVVAAVVLAIMPDSTKKAIYNQFARVNAPLPKPTSIPVLTPAPTLTPTPRPIAKGPQTYTSMGGSGASTGPTATQVWVSEFDPKIGQEQIFKVKTKDSQGVASVELKLITDNKSKAYPFKLISGTAIDGEWQVNITTDDSHDYIYSPHIAVKSSNGKISTVELSFR